LCEERASGAALEKNEDRDELIRSDFPHEQMEEMTRRP
jgi:hypothetical protein